MTSGLLKRLETMAESTLTPESAFFQQHAASAIIVLACGSHWLISRVRQLGFQTHVQRRHGRSLSIFTHSICAALHNVYRPGIIDLHTVWGIQAWSYRSRGTGDRLESQSWNDLLLIQQLVCEKAGLLNPKRVRLTWFQQWELWMCFKYATKGARIIKSGLGEQYVHTWHTENGVLKGLTNHKKGSKNCVNVASKLCIGNSLYVHVGFSCD